MSILKWSVTIRISRNHYSFWVFLSHLVCIWQVFPPFNWNKIAKPQKVLLQLTTVSFEMHPSPF